MDEYTNNERLESGQIPAEVLELMRDRVFKLDALVNKTFQTTEVHYSTQINNQPAAEATVTSTDSVNLTATVSMSDHKQAVESARDKVGEAIYEQSLIEENDD